MPDIPSDWANPCRLGDPLLEYGHLGGTTRGGDPDSWFPELWDWACRTFHVRSVLDIGCGAGHAMQWFYRRSDFIDVGGVDCEQVLSHHVLRPNEGRGVALWAHDLTTGAIDLTATEGRHDLVWCCDVAEHVEEKFVDNVVKTLAVNTGKVLAFCAAPKGAGGYHHVNCQDPPYWVDRLTAAGLAHRPELTAHARSLCTEANGRSAHNYFRRSGLIFTRDTNA
jgi:hypothetical protein